MSSLAGITSRSLHPTLRWCEVATILSRSAWTSTSASGPAFNFSRMRGIVVHYPAAGKAIGEISKEAVAAKLRGWRNYHVNGRGWSDIGYNYGIDQAGRIWSLRGDRVGAHTAGHNSTTIGVLFVVGDNEPLTDKAKQAFRDLRAHLRRKKNTANVWGHTQMSGASTRCPGPYIMGSLRDGSLLSGKASAARPAGPAKKKDSGPQYTRVDYGDTLKLYTQGEPVKDVQRALGVHPDGFYGPNTKNAVQVFQRKRGLAVDGVVGPETWAALKGSKPAKKPAKPATPAKPKGKAPGPGHPFPLPKGHYFGPRNGGDRSVSGYYGRRFNGVKDSSWLIRFAEQLARRGWPVGKGKTYLRSGVDGKYGPEYTALVKAFQKDQGLRADGLIGEATWDAAYQNPVS